MSNTIKKILALSLVLIVQGCGYINNSSKVAPTPMPTLIPTPTPDIFKEDEFTKLPAKTKLTNEPYIKSKTLTYFQLASLDKIEKKEKISWVLDNNSNLPRAQTPEEVGTVILRRCNEIKIGEYADTLTDGKISKIPAYGWKCEITIVDKTIPAVIHKKTFQTELKNIKNVSPNAKDVRENPPYNEMNDFLKSLLQK